MDNKPYVNPFENVHKKVQALKDQARKVKEHDAEMRERNQQEAASAEGDDKSTT